MSGEVAVRAKTTLTVPALIADAGDGAARRFFEFFTANIRNPNTRAAYAQAVRQFFDWCQARRLGLRDIEPVAVAAYIESLQRREAKPLNAPSVKQHLAAIRTLFDWLVVGQVVPTNPATSVRGPKHVVKRGKTPVLSAERRQNAARQHPDPDRPGAARPARPITARPTWSASAIGP